MTIYGMGRESLIAVIGVTGAGKTTFISKATGRNDLEIGHGLDSCTREVQAVPFMLDGKMVTLIDTPGFDDSDLSDTAILQLVAEYMVKMYHQNRLLSGLVLLQPIDQTRLQGSEVKRTRLFKKILGENAYKRVVIATTMWSQVQDTTIGESRQTERERRDDVWGDMVSQGSQVVRHENTTESALDIIRKLINHSTSVTLQIQEELQGNGGKLDQTSAGREINNDLEKQIKKLYNEIEYVRNERDATLQELRELQDKLAEKEEEKANLKKPAVSLMTPQA
ncbi:hypothetical protein PT974_01727 [Cladobotryum mycophilum]|uniref:G domain-containing protein n=1 Tax=Cladobotryum mycophilum TaxID=491253 RepID=A0ABR0SW77_9HYPO